MANTLKLGAGKWATGTDTVLAFNDENNNFKPLPFDFSRASSATVVNQSGLIETVGVGEPRIDFKDNTKGALLLEPQRTNLINQSQTFIGGWSKLNGVVVSGEKVTSPDGTLNASQLVFNGTTGGRIERGITNLTQGADYTVSVYARVSSGTQVVRFGSVADFEYTLTTEWQRLTSTQPENDTIAYPRFRCDDAATIEIYAFQLEQGSYATSYIPTSGSAVTRVAEQNNLSSINHLIGATQGSWFLDWGISNSDTRDNTEIGFELSSDNSQDELNFSIGSDGNMRMFVRVNNTYSQKYTTINKSGKWCLIWNGTSLKLFQDGLQVYSDENALVYNNYTTYNMSPNIQYKLNNTQIFNLALTDAEAIALTTI